MNEQYLVHYGILGMKWGIRRYQNKDGTLTPAGKKRKAKLRAELDQLENGNKENNFSKKTFRHVSSMSDEELKSRLSRMRNEAEYIRLRDQISPKKKSRVKKVLADIAENTVKTLSSKAVKKIANNLFGDSDNKKNSGT